MAVVAKTGFSFNHKSQRRSSASFTMWKPCFITSFPKWDNKLWVTIPLIDAGLESEFPSSPIGFFQGGLVWWNLPVNCEILQDRDIFYQTFSHHWAACRWEKEYWGFIKKKNKQGHLGMWVHSDVWSFFSWCVCSFLFDYIFCFWSIAVFIHFQWAWLPTTINMFFSWNFFSIAF